MKPRFLLVLLIATALCAGCAALKKLEPPEAEYVKADVQFEDVLGARIEAWIAADADLTETEKQALDLALQAWRAMVLRAADANEIPHSIEVSSP